MREAERRDVTEQRCVLCNKVISAAEISGAIEYALWEESLREGTTNEMGGDEPPVEANWDVTHTDRWGWVHTDCASTYGSGETPEARKQAWVEAMMRFLHGEEGNEGGGG